MGCHNAQDRSNDADIALVGNPNVGKSLLFNEIVGGRAVVSNYPGTTVEILEGKSRFDGKTLVIADLPGTYSLKSDSEDEIVTRDYINSSKPKLIVNIIDATKLERNLFLTFQLMKTKIPLVIALNLNNEAKNKGNYVDPKKLSSLLGVTVVEINPTRGEGIKALMIECMSKMDGKTNLNHKINVKKNDIQMNALASLISSKVIIKSAKQRNQFISDKIDSVTTGPVSGIFFLLFFLALLFGSLFLAGGFLSNLIGKGFNNYIAPFIVGLINHATDPIVRSILHYMFVNGIGAALGIVIPFVFVYSAIIAILEDSGYLARMAYLLDKTMQRLGLHGKAIIPMMLGFGCSIPAIYATRILSNSRERFLTAILITLTPCSARTAVILGAVGLFLGWQYALLIFIMILVLIVVIGYILGRKLPGEMGGLIMEMPTYRIPKIKNIIFKTYFRMSDFIIIALPILMIGSGIVGALMAMELMEPMLRPFEPIIGYWLMLPVSAGITLVLGILRKELALEMLIVLGGSSNLLLFMSPIQIFTFGLVVAIYIPCLATIAVLKREFGWKKATAISIFTTLIAFILGGLVARIFPLIGILK